MSTSRLIVSPGELEGLAQSIQQLLAEFDTHSNQIQNVDPGAAGHELLIGAINDFRSVWSSGISELGARSAQLSANVQASATAYSEADSAVRAAFER